MRKIFVSKKHSGVLKSRASGFVSLLDENEVLLDFKKYDCRTRMREVIRGFEQKIKHSTDKYWISIIPDGDYP